MKLRKTAAFVAMLLVLTLITVIPAAAATEDFVTDGGFETYNSSDQLFSTGSYWDKRSQCTAVVTNAEKRNGNNAVLMTPIASASSGGLEGIMTRNQVEINSADDDWYILDAYVKAASQTPDENLKGGVAIRCKNGGLLMRGPQIALSQSQWSRVHLVFQNTAENYGTQGYKPVIGIRQDGTFDGGNSAVYIDDVSLTVVQAARLDTPAGSETIAIPASGNVTESYTTTVYNEFNETKVSQSRVTWSLQESKEGVSIDAQSGVLTVSSTATAGTVNIVASQDGVSSQALSVELVSATNRNYVTDGGFETYNSSDQLFGTDSYWDKRSQCTAVVTDAAKRSGNNAVLMTPIASASSGGLEGIMTRNQVEINSADDDWYILDAYVKPASQTPDENLKGGVAIRCKNGGLLMRGPQIALSQSQWSRVYLVFQNTAENYGTQGYKPVIGIRQDGTFDGENSAVYIDDVSLTLVQAARLDTPAGSEAITIPASGSVTESYTTTVYNEFDETKVSQSRVTWSLQEAKEGVSIDAQSGVLTVSSTATAGTVNIIASQDGVSSTAKTVTLNQSVPANLTITVASAEHGRVLDGTENVAGSTVSVASGADKTFSLSPDAGYQVKSVLWGDQDVTSTVQNGEITLTNISQNETLTVTFELIPVTEPSVTGSRVITGTYTHGEKNYVSAVVYTSITAPAGWNLSRYGIYLTGNETTISLNAQGNANGQFGIRIFGEAVVPGSEFSARAFASFEDEGGSAVGEEEYLEESSRVIEISES